MIRATSSLLASSCTTLLVLNFHSHLIVIKMELISTTYTNVFDFHGFYTNFTEYIYSFFFEKLNFYLVFRFCLLTNRICFWVEYNVFCQVVNFTTPFLHYHFRIIIVEFVIQPKNISLKQQPYR